MENNYEFMKERVIDCICRCLDLVVDAVTINYIDLMRFYQCIKRNYPLEDEDIYKYREKCAFRTKITPGLYKWEEREIYIKEYAKFDFSTLLVELIHSQSITQGNGYIQKWISEGIPHYLAMILCKHCDIEYIESLFYQDYFKIWRRFHKIYGFDILKRIVFTDNIIETRYILQHTFHYFKDDILEIGTKEAMGRIYLQGV